MVNVWGQQPSEELVVICLAGSEGFINAVFIEGVMKVCMSFFAAAVPRVCSSFGAADVSVFLGVLVFLGSCCVFARFACLF